MEELTDVDLYESQTDKEKIEILHRCLATGNLDLIGVASSLLWSEASGKQPDKKTRQKVEMLSAEEHEAVAQVRQMMTDMMVGAGIEMTPANINTELQRGFSALKGPFSIVSDLRKAQVPEKIAGLRGCLTPPAEIASIFGRLGEEFRPQSGVLAIGADVDYLENLVVKREDEISPEEREQSPMDLVVACKDGKVMMVEAGMKEVPEETIIEAMHWAVDKVQPALDLQRELAKQVAATPQEYELVLPSEEIIAEVAEWTKGKFGSKIRGNVMERAQMLDDIKYAMHDEFALSKGQGETDNEKVAWYDENLRDVYDQAFELAVFKEVRRGIVEEGVRPDGRKLDEVRPLSSQVSILPRVHGSSLFTRGVTQAMNWRRLVMRRMWTRWR